MSHLCFLNKWILTVITPWANTWAADFKLQIFRCVVYHTMLITFSPLPDNCRVRHTKQTVFCVKPFAVTKQWDYFFWTVVILTSAAIAALPFLFYSPGTGWGQGVRRAKDVACDEWEDGLSARFLKSATIIRRDVTPVKQSFEVPICIVEANKGIFATSRLTRELYS